LPEFFIKNLPPVSTTSIVVTHPQIYFGESDAGYAIVNTKVREFDYPSGSDNAYTNYTGTGGVTLSSAVKKALFAMHFRELKILISSDITSKSKILYHRQILERIRHTLPFITFESDPYMVISKEGKLFWFVDGYTTTSNYPYSARVSGMGNYIRNSVKAVVDAYDGSMTFYTTRSDEPIIASYNKMFPGAFHPLSEMPTDLRAHIRYPQTLFTIQAQVYGTYHMEDPQVFYNREDLWRIVSNPETGSGFMSPYYTIMKLAGVGQREEFILMVPFSPAKKENLIAWFAARCDDPEYGKLLVFSFPKQKLVYGPQQIESRISQDAEISKQLTLWNQGGSRVIRGSMLVIPVEQSLLFVQPLYIAAENGGLPELKRVIVSYENSIAMEVDLETSLMRIFGESVSPSSSEEKNAGSSSEQQGSIMSSNLQGFIKQANDHYSAGQRLLGSRDLAGYEKEMKEVERLLGDMAREARR
jgi:uncharacterized membrane protein (UPF0182 family)